MSVSDQIQSNSKSNRHQGAQIEPFASTISEACRISGLSRSELYRRLATGDITAVKNGNRTLILIESLRAFIDRLPRASFRTPADQNANN